MLDQYEPNWPTIEVEDGDLEVFSQLVRMARMLQGRGESKIVPKDAKVLYKKEGEQWPKGLLEELATYCFRPTVAASTRHQAALILDCLYGEGPRDITPEHEHLYCE